MHLSGVKDQKYEVVVGDDAMVGTCSTRQHNQNKLSLLNVQENPRLVPVIKAAENIKVQNPAKPERRWRVETIQLTGPSVC